MKSFFAFKSQPADAWTELVFAQRNRNYGAYTLRRDYDRHVIQAFLITCGVLALLYLALSAFKQNGLVDRALPGVSDSGYEIVAPTIVPPKLPAATASGHNAKKITSNPIIADVDSSNVVMDTAVHVATVGSDSVRTGGSANASGGSGDDGKAMTPDTTHTSDAIEMLPQVMPEFKGGMDALLKYLAGRIDCPVWRERGETGSVVFSLVIGKDGKVTDVQVLKDEVGFGCAEQAARVIRQMPAWKPGRNGNHPVNVRYVLPVRYEKN
ncbi:MAG TPA: energy transducer TonB [Chitinophagales bacterium]|nr:energy transducer TonB [Chitinophagales bacterium]